MLVTSASNRQDTTTPKPSLDGIPQMFGKFRMTQTQQHNVRYHTEMMLSMWKHWCTNLSRTVVVSKLRSELLFGGGGR